MVLLATIAWRWVYIPAFAVGIIPMMILGVACCTLAIWSNQRKLATLGLVLGLAVVFLSVVFVAWQIWRGMRRVAATGLDVTQYVQMAMSAQGLVELAEAGRLSDGRAGEAIDMSKIPAPYGVDVWGRSFVYEVCSSCQRGYRIWSVGPDGASGTSDDVDMLSLEIEGAFALPAQRKMGP